MRTTLISLAGLAAWAIAPHVAYASDPAPCKGLRLKEDPFTHVPSAAYGVTSSFSSGLSVGFNLIFDGTASLRISYNIPAAHAEMLPAGHTANLLLSDGSMLPLVAQADVAPAAKVAEDIGVYTNYAVAYTMDKATTQRLAATPPTTLRAPMPTVTGQSTWSFSKGAQKVVSRVGTCYASLMP